MAFPAQMEDIAETEEFEFTYILALYQSITAGPPTVADAAFFADEIDIATPVLADPSQRIADSMPFEGSIPARCALTPRMRMIECYTGKPDSPEEDPAIDAIRAHWESEH